MDITSLQKQQIMAKTAPKRMVIYPKDIERITGKKTRSAHNYFQSIKNKLGKGDSELVSIDEFCTVTGFNREKVEEYIID